MILTLLDYIFKLVESFPTHKKVIPPNREKYGEEIWKLLTDKLKQLLETMRTYVGIRINKISDIIREKNKNSSFKEFKLFFIKMLQSFGNLTYLII